MTDSYKQFMLTVLLHTNIYVFSYFFHGKTILYL